MKTFYLLIIGLIFSHGLSAQAVGEYRSKITGSWNSTSTWERYNGVSWVSATNVPAISDGAIFIQGFHTVTIQSSTTVNQDQIIVNANGNLNIAGTLSMSAGTLAHELNVSGNVTLTGSLTFGTNALMNLGAGSNFIFNTNLVTPLSISNVTTFSPTSLWRFRSTATQPNPLVALSGSYGNIYFENINSTAWSPSFSGSSDISCNNFNLGSNINLTNNATGKFTVSGDFYALSSDGILLNGTGFQRYYFNGTNKSIAGTSSGNINGFYDSLIITSTARVELQSNLSAAAASIFFNYGYFDINSNTLTGALFAQFKLFKNSTFAYSGSPAPLSVTGFGTATAEDSVNYEVNSANASPPIDFWNYNIKNLTINNNPGNPTQYNSPNTLNIRGTLFLTQGSFDVSSTIAFYGSPISVTSGSMSVSSTSGLEFHGSTAGHYLPTTVSTLGKLKMNNSSGLAVNNTIYVESELQLLNGLINMGSNTLYFKDTINYNISGASANSYVNGLLGIMMKTGTNTLTFPVGNGSQYFPAAFSNLTTTGPAYLTVGAYATTPSGTGNLKTVFSMANRYWRCWVSASNIIQSMGNISLEPNGISPSLGPNSVIAISNNDFSRSYRSLGGSVAGSSISSSTPWPSFMISNVSTTTGCYLGIGSKLMPSGNYCIGFSAGYSPPSGFPSYVNGLSAFTSLTEAVNALNTNTITGHVVFEFQSDYISGGDALPLMITYQGSPSATATFRTRSDATSSLLFSEVMPGTDTSTALVIFDGADYVTIDGSPGGTLGTTSRLIFRNQSVGGQNNFIIRNDATNITLNGIQSEATGGGKNIIIGNGISTGNDFITISNCLLTNISSYFIKQQIYLIDSATGPLANDNLTISGNSITNCEYGIRINGGIRNTVNITNNSIYFTGIFTQKLGRAIEVISTNNLVNLNISGNSIGGNAAGATGSNFSIGGSTTPTIIYIDNNFTGSTNTLSSNTIRKLNVSGLTGSEGFTGIRVIGPASITSNLIGDNTSGSGITFDSFNSVNTNFTGIHHTQTTATATNSISSNTIRYISSSATAAVPGIFTGVKYSSTGGAFPVTVNSNNISNISFTNAADLLPIEINGGNTAGNTVSIQNNKLTTMSTGAGRFRGIYNQQTPANISGNKIGLWFLDGNISTTGNVNSVGIEVEGSNGILTLEDDTVYGMKTTGTGTYQLTGISLNVTGAFAHSIKRNKINTLEYSGTLSGSDDGTYASTALVGLYDNIPSTLKTISNNEIIALSAKSTSTTTSPALVALFISGGGTISANRIYYLSNSAGNTTNPGSLTGIRNNATIGNTLVNNMIVAANHQLLGTGSNAMNVYGIYQNSAAGVNNVYFNSVLVSGSTTSPGVRSCALWVNSTGGSNDIRNNILSNTRSGGAKNYAIGYASGNAAFWGTSNFNNLFSSNATTLGAWPAGTDRTFATWKTTSASDAASLNLNPGFTSTIDLHLTNITANCPLTNTGTPINGITSDYDGNTRDGSPTLGLDETVTVCLNGGVYCVGPSSSYSPPIGVTYLNATNPYPSISAAVTALNAGYFQGSVIFELQNDFAGAGEIFPINISFQGNPGLTATFRVRSDIVNPVQLSGSLSSVDNSQGLIMINGADYVTFDGSPGGTLGDARFLKIANTSSQGVSNFFIQGDSRRITLNGLTSMAARWSRNINMGGTAGTSGNDSLTISHCELRNMPGATPDYQFYSNSVASGAAASNNLTMINNQFTGAYRSISITNGVTGSITLSGNHFFEAGGSILDNVNGISLICNEPSQVVVTNNYYGGEAIHAGGPRMLVNSAWTTAFNINNDIAGSSTLLSSNIVRNIEVQNVTNTTGFVAFDVSGPATISDNQIGDSSTPNSLLFNGNSQDFKGIVLKGSVSQNSVISSNRIENIAFTNETHLQWINFIEYNNVSPSHTVTVSGNSIRKITADYPTVMEFIYVFGPIGTGTSAIIQNNKIEAVSANGGGRFNGIFVNANNATISGNRVGNNDPLLGISYAPGSNSKGLYVSGPTTGMITIEDDTICNILLTDTVNPYNFTGIYFLQSGSNHVIRRNIVENVSCFSAMPSTLTSPIDSITLCGIYCNSESTGTTGSLASNIIRNLSVENTGNITTAVTGIYSDANTSIRTNSIYKLYNKSLGGPVKPIAAGLLNSGNNASVGNNMISLINNTSNPMRMYGILDKHTSGSSVFYYFNSIHIGGIGNDGTDRSYAFYRNGSAGSQIFRNNILNNVRSGSGKNYAIGTSLASLAIWPTASSNYNSLYSADPSTLCQWGSSDRNLSNWRTSAGSDNSSLEFSPVFLNNENDLHVVAPDNCVLKSKGLSVSGYTTDFDNQARANPPTIGADEITQSCNPLVNIRVFIEGFYENNEKMRPLLSLLNLTTDTTLCDTMQVELRLTTSPFALHSTYTGLLHTDGALSITVPQSLLNQSFYLRLQHRNSVETWSKTPVTITYAPVNYDFTGAAGSLNRLPSGQ